MNLIEAIENIDLIEKEYIKLGFKTKKVVYSVSTKLDVNNFGFHFQFSYHALKDAFNFQLHYTGNVKYGTYGIITHDSIIPMYLYTLDFMENYSQFKHFLQFSADSYISKEREFKINALQDIINT